LHNSNLAGAVYPKYYLKFGLSINLRLLMEQGMRGYLSKIPENNSIKTLLSGILRIAILVPLKKGKEAA